MPSVSRLPSEGAAVYFGWTTIKIFSFHKQTPGLPVNQWRGTAEQIIKNKKKTPLRVSGPCLAPLWLLSEALNPPKVL